MEAGAMPELAYVIAVLVALWSRWKGPHHAES